MRITGGGARGILLHVPKDADIRPATDGLRQSVFSSLAARIAGSRFLDLYAGSGAYGLEAFSRGAQSGTFVERDPKTLACLRKNAVAVCKSVGRDGSLLAVLSADASHPSAIPGAAPDLIFVDPPYETIETIAEGIFASLTQIVAQVNDPLVVFEMPGEITLSPPGWREVKRIGKGRRQPTAVFFLKAG